MSPAPAFTPTVPEGTTVHTLETIPCPEGTRQTGGVHQEHSVLSVDPEDVHCIEFPVPLGAIPVRRGPAVLFHADGSVRSQGQYDAGERTGLWEERYENGRRKSLVHYREGRLHGSYFTWWENGQPQSEIEWREGKHHGISKTWADDGTTLGVRRYVDDEVIEAWSYGTDGTAHRL